MYAQADKYASGDYRKHHLLLLAFIFTLVLSNLKKVICTAKLKEKHSVPKIAGEDSLPARKFAT